MPLQLPTDTQHLQLETRQYELFNRPLGQGISRRKAAFAGVVTGLWVVVMLVLGVDLFAQYGPITYIVPPAFLAYFGVRTGDDGRMTILIWYDALLLYLPSRRRTIRNPLLSVAGYSAEPIRIVADMTELHPRPNGAAITPLVGRHSGEDTT